MATSVPSERVKNIHAKGCFHVGTRLPPASQLTLFVRRKDSIPEARITGERQAVKGTIRGRHSERYHCCDAGGFKLSFIYNYVDDFIMVMGQERDDRDYLGRLAGNIRAQYSRHGSHFGNGKIYRFQLAAEVPEIHHNPRISAGHLRH